MKVLSHPGHLDTDTVVAVRSTNTGKTETVDRHLYRDVSPPQHPGTKLLHSMEGHCVYVIDAWCSNATKVGRRSADVELLM